MGQLYIVSTPIGNLDDITVRALKTLFNVDFIACEDTRRTGQLLAQLAQRYASIIQSFKIKKAKLISYYDEVEQQKAPDIINLIKHGFDVALVSDAGTPLLSDPGFKLVYLAINQNIKIVPVPGPSSILTALVASGLPAYDFHFLGYLPNKQSKRITMLQSARNNSRMQTKSCTFIVFESPLRLRQSLNDIKNVFGDINVVLARELTKIHEGFIRDKISNILLKDFTVKGEFVVLFNIPQE